MINQIMDAHVLLDGTEPELISGGVFVSSTENAVADQDEGDSKFWAFSSTNGKIMLLDGESMSGRPHASMSTRGQPTGVAVDSEGKLFVSDVQHQAILWDGNSSSNNGGGLSVVVEEYEGKRFLGPSSVAVGEDDTVFFTDSGPLGTSSLEDPCGSVYAIKRDANGSILHRLANSCLAHPCGICVGADGSVYVCEMLKNRVLRFTQSPHGAYICSVFHQFSGRMGPSALAFDPVDAKLYVARYDFYGDACISVLNTSSNACVSPDEKESRSGHHCRHYLKAVGGAQISALILNNTTRELITCEASTRKVVRSDSLGGGV